MWRTLLHILFPSPCVQCGFLSESLCQRCFSAVAFEPHERPLNDLMVYSACFYKPDSILARLIKPFKYSHQADLFRHFIPWMLECFRLLHTPGRIVFVPVPLHTERLHERGYNQAALLARCLAKKLGFPYAELLERGRDTGHQAQLKERMERSKNMEDAFLISTKMASSLPIFAGYSIVLVDDIVTTGSTLLACAKVLRGAGFESVMALTLADREKTMDHRH